jgi:hypothetical protein
MRIGLGSISHRVNWISMNPLQVLGIEELLTGDHALDGHDEPVRILLIAT